MNKNEFLLDMLEYYTVDPNNRRCTTSVGCTYAPESLGLTTSEGCAIGRKLPPDVALAIDVAVKLKGQGGTISDPVVWNALPSEIQELGFPFLKSVQYLHDSDSPWDADGLTMAGRHRVESIIKENHLDASLFTKYTNAYETV